MMTSGGGDVVDLADEEDDAVFEQEHLVDGHFACALVRDVRGGHKRFLRGRPW